MVEDLTDEQVGTLLQEAARRLGNNATALQGVSASANLSLHRLENRSIDDGLPSYIKIENRVAHVESQPPRTTSEPRLVQHPVATKVASAKAKAADAGPKWFNMPRTELTPELRRDFQLLGMRSVLDPKRHYKKENRRNKIPEYSQVGTVIEGPTEHISGRLTNKERKRTFVEEVVAGETAAGRFKAKYDDIQKAKTSGRRGHYKVMKAKRRSRG